MENGRQGNRSFLSDARCISKAFEMSVMLIVSTDLCVPSKLNERSLTGQVSSSCTTRTLICDSRKNSIWVIGLDRIVQSKGNDGGSSKSPSAA